MNTEKIVSFETAKIAKEKGFDEKCSHYYVLDFQNFEATGKLCKTGLPDNWDNPNILQFVKRTNQPHLANAPTQSLLQKWIRDVYGIHILVSLEFDMGAEEYIQGQYYFIVHGTLFSSEIFPDTEYDTYEEALEVALQTSLNLINND